MTPRLSFSGLGSTGNAAVNVSVVGVDPKGEEDFADFEVLVAGRPLEPGDSEAGLIGEELRNGLGAEIGDWVTVLTSSFDGVINAVDFRVAGVVRTGSKEYDSVFAKVPIELAQRAVETGQVERIVVLLENTEDLPRIQPRIEEILSTFDRRFETRRWDELAGFYDAVVALYTGIFTVFAGIVGVVVMFSVANTMTMAVFERTGEIGALRAIGARRSTLVAMFLTEGAGVGPARRRPRGGGVVADRRRGGDGGGHPDAAASRHDPGIPGLLQAHRGSAARCTCGHHGRDPGVLGLPRLRGVAAPDRGGAATMTTRSTTGGRGAAAGICLFSLAFVAGSAPAQERTLLQQVDTVRAPDSAFTFKVAVTAPDGDALKLSVRVADRLRSLVRYLEPPRSAGRSLLFIERNMWVYVPGTRQVLRISPRQRVLGGVASADVARMVYSVDYALDAVEELAEEGGERRRLLTLSRRSKGAAYARITLVAAGEDARPLQASFSASSDRRHLKTMYFEGYREVLGRLRPTVLRLIDHLNGDEETVLEYSDFTLEDTPDAWFQPTYLKRLR